jgi:hypothetical protein
VPEGPATGAKGVAGDSDGEPAGAAETLGAAFEADRGVADVFERLRGDETSISMKGSIVRTVRLRVEGVALVVEDFAPFDSGPVAVELGCMSTSAEGPPSAPPFGGASAAAISVAAAAGVPVSAFLFFGGRPRFFLTGGGAAGALGAVPSSSSISISAACVRNESSTSDYARSHESCTCFETLTSGSAVVDAAFLPFFVVESFVAVESSFFFFFVFAPDVLASG